MAAVGTNPVRQHRFVALAAILNLQGFDMLVASPLALPGMRGPPFRDCHEYQPSGVERANQESGVRDQESEEDFLRVQILISGS
jgi:hypothetical protein